MTYTAVAGGGNWNDPATWGGTSGYPVAGDTAVLNASSGNVTVNVASACDNLNCTGYTGTLTHAATLTIYGNLAFSAGMTLTDSGGSLIVFAATTTGKTITSAGKTPWRIQFNGSGGEWTLQDDLTAGPYYPSSITCTAGTVVLNGHTLTSPDGGWNISGSGFVITGGSGGLSAGFYSLTIGSGVVVTFTTGGIFACSNLTVDGTLTFSGAGYINSWGGNIALGSNFSGDQVTLTIRGGVGKTLSSVNPIGALVIGLDWYWANCGVTLASDVEVKGDVTIVANASYSVTLALDSYTLTIGGDFENNETFDAGTGTVEFNDASQESIVRGSTATTFNVLKCQAAGKTVKFKASQTVTVASFDFDGADGDLITLDTDTGADTWTLSDSSGTDSVTYCDIHRSAAAGGATFLAYTSDGNVDGGGNTGWSFSAAEPAGNMMLMFH